MSYYTSQKRDFHKHLLAVDAHGNTCTQMLLVQRRFKHVNHYIIENTFEKIFFFLVSESQTLIPLSLLMFLIPLDQPAHTGLWIGPGLNHLALYLLNSFLTLTSVLVTLP